MGYAPQQTVTLEFPDDSVTTQFEASSGYGWRILGQGKPAVGLPLTKMSIKNVQGSTAGCFQCIYNLQLQILGLSAYVCFVNFLCCT